MSLCVIDRFVSKKQRDLLEYAKILESIISLDKNDMWHNKKEFSSYAKEIIKIYADNYYFDNNSHKSNPIDYSNDNINCVLHAIVDYFKAHDEMEKIKVWKNETFLLSVIICTACYVDFATNIVDGDFNDTRYKFKYLLDYFRKTKILKISNNKYWVNDLFDSIKKNVNTDKKFLESFYFDLMHNDYNIYTNNPLMYKVDFKYTVPGIEDKDTKMIEKIEKEYKSKFLEISNELLHVKILADLISNKEMKTYVIKTGPALNKKTTITKFFDNRYIKEYIKLIVPYEEMGLYNNVEAKTDNLLYEYSKNSEISANALKSNATYIVSQRFLDNNEVNKLSWENKSINFIVKNEED